MNNLEEKLDEIYAYKNLLEKIKKEKEKEEEEKEKERIKKELGRSKILLENEYKLLISWLEKIPKK